MPKVLIVEFCALKFEVYRQVKIMTLCSSSSFFSKKNKSEKKMTHQHSQHTVCDSVSSVTEGGYHPGVPVCLLSGTGSVVREVQGVFSVFFINMYK
jgi:hypothetical protein